MARKNRNRRRQQGTLPSSERKQRGTPRLGAVETRTDGETQAGGDESATAAGIRERALESSPGLIVSSVVSCYLYHAVSYRVPIITLTLLLCSYDMFASVWVSCFWFSVSLNLWYPRLVRRRALFAWSSPWAFSCRIVQLAEPPTLEPITRGSRRPFFWSCHPRCPALCRPRFPSHPERQRKPTVVHHPLDGSAARHG